MFKHIILIVSVVGLVGCGGGGGDDDTGGKDGGATDGGRLVDSSIRIIDGSTTTVDSGADPCCFSRGQRPTSTSRRSSSQK